MIEQGIFIVSLDFELNWGVHDVFRIEQYKENLLGAREAIPRILELFRRYDIHATWATVGMLLFDQKNELMSNLPSLRPNYTNLTFSPYEKLDHVGGNELQDPFHFGASLIKKILEYPNQELASHTFSHYYCLEKGQTAAEFEADLKAFDKVIDRAGCRAKSIVFPRNQIHPEYLRICRDFGIQSYRGYEENWVYQVGPYHQEGVVKRFLRVFDSYVNMFGHHTYPICKVEKEPIVNLPASRFLRPYNTLLKKLEPLRLNRIKKSITSAAENSEVFHLWWHPHNFGKNIELNIHTLEEILIHVSDLKAQYGLKSLNMNEASALAMQMNSEKCEI